MSRAGPGGTKRDLGGQGARTQGHDPRDRRVGPKLGLARLGCSPVWGHPGFLGVPLPGCSCPSVLVVVVLLCVFTWFPPFPFFFSKFISLFFYFLKFWGAQLSNAQSFFTLTLHLAIRNPGHLRSNLWNKCGSDPGQPQARPEALTHHFAIALAPSFLANCSLGGLGRLLNFSPHP